MNKMIFILVACIFSFELHAQKATSYEVLKDYYPSGVVRSQTQILNNLPVGIEYEFYENGKISGVKYHELDSTGKPLNRSFNYIFVEDYCFNCDYFSCDSDFSLKVLRYEFKYEWHESGDVKRTFQFGRDTFELKEYNFSILGDTLNKFTFKYFVKKLDSSEVKFYCRQIEENRNEIDIVFLKMYENICHCGCKSGWILDGYSYFFEPKEMIKRVRFYKNGAIVFEEVYHHGKFKGKIEFEQ